MNASFDAVTKRAAHYCFTPVVQAEIGAAARYYQRELNRLARAAEAHSRPKMMRRRVEGLLNSRRAKICGLLRWAKWPAGTTFGELAAAADAVTYEAMRAERIIVDQVTKPEGGYRTITKFGITRQVYQQICHDVIAAVFPAMPFEYLRAGRGPERLTTDIVEHIEREALSFVATADIRNCFGSVRKEALVQLLPIPRWAINDALLISADANVVDFRSLGGLRLAPDDAARQGLPQGAITSGIILSRVILGPVLSTAPFVDRIHLYGDNTAVPVRSRLEGETLLDALRSLLRNTPAGPLSIGDASVDSINQGVELVKFRFRRVGAWWGGGIRITPARKAYRRYGARVSAKAAAGASNPELQDYSDRWLRSYRSLWQPNSISAAYFRTHTLLSSLLGRACRTS